MSLKNLIKAVEGVTQSLKNIDTDHAYIHQRRHFSYFNYDTLSTGTSKFYAFMTPADTLNVHYRPEIISNSADKVRVILYEGSEISGGSSIKDNVINHNRNSSRTTQMQSVSSGISHDTPGDIIFLSFYPGGTASRTGNIKGQKNEIVLATDTIYVVEVINNSTGNNIINIQLHWYEEDIYNFT